MMQRSDNELSLTGRRWRWPDTICATPAGDRMHAIANGTQVAGSSGGNDSTTTLPIWFEELLRSRGVEQPDAIAAYLEPTLVRLPDPSLMADADRAVSRLERAISAEETIIVYGDYDVDGVCATTVMVEFLRQVGARVEFYIPDRRSEGYGLNEAAIRELAARASLLVTVDCGITAHHEIGIAQSLGSDVIVVDHHTVGDELPPAHACLNPHRPDCGYPFDGLCAAGVAFMLVVALRRSLRRAGAFATRPEPDLRVLLDVVALATVADMVPIRDANRILVAAGLRRMAASRRTGLLALCEVATVSLDRVTTYDLGFRLGPRINARGRLSHAAQAVELLLTDDATRAKELATQLDTANRARRELEAATVEVAVERVLDSNMADESALVLYDANWHPGILGLVASRLAARFHRPAVVIGEGGKGSGRTIGNLDLYGCIAAGQEHLIRFGGHHAAAGITIDPKRIEAFRSAFCGAVREELGPPPYVAEVKPELEVHPEHLDLNMVATLEGLAPFGQGNPEPLLAARNLEVRSKRLVGGQHLKLRLGTGSVDAIGFGLGAVIDDLPKKIDAAFRLERNVYMGRTTVQLRLEDLREAQASAPA